MVGGSQSEHLPSTGMDDRSDKWPIADRPPQYGDGFRILFELILSFFHWVFSPLFPEKPFEQMDCPVITSLKTALKAGYPDQYMIWNLFQECWKYKDGEVKKRAISLILQYAHKTNGNQAVMRKIINDLPNDYYIQERTGMIINFPDTLSNHPTIIKSIANYVTEVVFEKNVRKYSESKINLGSFLLLMPNSQLILDHEPAVIPDEGKLSLVAYMEQFVHPVFSPGHLRFTTNMFTLMAKNIKSSNFAMFLDLIMSSVNYSFHRMLEAFTSRAEQGCIPVSKAIRFMELKRGVCEYSEAFGNIPGPMKNEIEIEFVLAVLHACSAREFDVFLHEIKKKRLLAPSLFNKMAKRLSNQLQVPAIPIFNRHAFNCLVRQTMLAYHTNELERKKKPILKRALTMERFIRNFTSSQVNQYITMLVTLSYPRVEEVCKANIGLLEKLLHRLGKLLPPLDQTEVTIEFNAFQSVVYCMYQMFDNCIGLKGLLGRIMPRWRPMFLHVVDLQTITTANIGNKLRTSDHDDDEYRNALLHDQMAMTFVGSLLVAQFGILHGRHIDYFPDHLASEETKRALGLQDALMSDFFTLTRPLHLTMEKDFDGDIGFPHRVLEEREGAWEANVFEMNLPPTGNIRDHFVLVSDSESDSENEEDEQEDEGQVAPEPEQEVVGEQEQEVVGEQEQEVVGEQEQAEVGEQEQAEAGEQEELNEDENEELDESTDYDSDEDGTITTTVFSDNEVDGDDEDEDDQLECRYILIDDIHDNTIRNHYLLADINAQELIDHIAEPEEDDEPVSEYSAGNGTETESDFENVDGEHDLEDDEDQGADQ